MGIKNLAKLIADGAPAAVKEVDLPGLTGRKVAIDASMAIYQFLVAVRSSDAGAPATQLTNEAGEVTSHLQGMFNRTIRFMESGIKPCFVFDGKPPTMKGGELAKRQAMKEKAEADLKAAEAEGKAEDVERYSKRTVRMTKDHQSDCKQLLRLMGVPVVEAPCEAEAQCAELAKKGKVFAAGSEDMDTLTFMTPVLLRRLTFSDAKKMPVLQFDMAKVLAGLDLTQAQFVDLCILCGCDYTDTIRGVGHKTALNLIKTHGCFVDAVAALDKTKYSVPESLLEDYEHAKKLFLTPEVTAAEELELKWTDCDEEGLKRFLIEEKGFNPDRVLRGIEKLKKAKGKGAQQRMDSFFAVKPSTTAGVKRKPDAAAAKGKKGKFAGKGKGKGRPMGGAGGGAGAGARR